MKICDSREYKLKVNTYNKLYVSNRGLWNIWFDKEMLSDWCGEFLYQQLQYYYKCDLRLKRWILSNLHRSNVIYTALLNHNYGYYYETPNGKRTGEIPKL